MDNYSKTEENKFGIIFCYNEYRNLHRIDGPAVIWKNGDKDWYLYDKWVNEDIHKIHMDSIFGVTYG